MSYFRPSIERMAAYSPGEQPQEKGYIKLNTNENPYPPSPRVLEALRAQVGPEVRLYPDPLATLVRQAAARAYPEALPGPEWVLVGNGSDELLTIAMRAFVDPGERVAYPVPTYTLYRTLAEIQDAAPVEVPFPPDFSLPPELGQARAKLTLLANPNSPTATVVPRDDVARLAEQCSGILLIDEAYADFAEQDCLDFARRFDNVVVLRTLSKSFNLCGLRVGFAGARPALIEGMLKVKDSYNVNRFGIYAGAAALDDIEYMRRNAERIKRTRARLVGELERLGFTCLPSQANFVLARAPSGQHARRLYERLKERKILVRYFERPRLDDCLRISIGADAEIDALLEALRQLVAARD